MMVSEGSKVTHIQPVGACLLLHGLTCLWIALEFQNRFTVAVNGKTESAQI